MLSAIMVKRKTPSKRRSKHLCADAGYRGQKALEIIESHGYIAHAVDRRTEADAKRRDPSKKARRWVVEVYHSWFNRFRKLLVRYEELERSFVALNHIATAIIALR
ncbi:transposase, partial [Rhodoferax sp.]|uniref:transposase n=1 Tax=Rhodoferax sp. TaxID=50421 RepID=UPI003BB578D2